MPPPLFKLYKKTRKMVRVGFPNLRSKPNLTAQGLPSCSCVGRAAAAASLKGSKATAASLAAAGSPHSSSHHWPTTLTPAAATSPACSPFVQFLEPLLVILFGLDIRLSSALVRVLLQCVSQLMQSCSRETPPANDFQERGGGKLTR